MVHPTKVLHQSLLISRTNAFYALQIFQIIKASPLRSFAQFHCDETGLQPLVAWTENLSPAQPVMLQFGSVSLAMESRECMASQHKNTYSLMPFYFHHYIHTGGLRPGMSVFKPQKL